MIQLMASRRGRYDHLALLFNGPKMGNHMGFKHKWAVNINRSLEIRLFIRKKEKEKKKKKKKRERDHV